MNSVLRTIHHNFNRIRVRLTLPKWAVIRQRDVSINDPDEFSVESVKFTMPTLGMACTIRRYLITVLCWLLVNIAFSFALTPASFCCRMSTAEVL